MAENLLAKLARVDPAALLTMERQFCRICWGAGLRVKVFDLAVQRRDRGFKLRRRNAVLRHLRAAHPEVVPK